MFSITYGIASNVGYGGDTSALDTIFVKSVKDVKKWALEFVKVIPDDIDDQVKEIEDWDGSAPLVFAHQDDDTFYFSANLVSLTKDFDKFTRFVSHNRVED